MAIALNDSIVQQDIIDRFHLRVRDYVTSQTDWISTTVMIAAGSRTLNTIVSNSTTGGTSVGGNYPGSFPAGTYNRTAYSTKTPASVTTADFSAQIGASQATVGHVMQILKEFMNVYANNHIINLRNTGNLTTAGARTSFNLITHTGSARLNGVPSSVITSINTDLTNSAVTRNIAPGSLITATNLNNLIEDCKTIWQNRCNTSAVEEFRYSYCHSSCHSNHGSHGSRGRR